MKTFYFTIKHAHWRNGTTVALTAGVVRAINEDEAEKIIFQNVSTTNTFGLFITEMKGDENCFTDYIPASIFS